MENSESLVQGAERETREEANARVEMGELYSIYSLPHINQVHVLFRARLLDLDFKPGVESLDVKLFQEAEIPWDTLAFRVIREPLNRYFEERRRGQLGFHLGTIEDVPK
jgi:ADP-ribose pyrophosphatase YjhB (NUDIX family)